MSELVATLRAIIRDELARFHFAELATVTQVHDRDGDDKSNHQVTLRLRGSGTELQRVPVAVGRPGLSALPNEGDLMLVTFIGGRLNAPVAVGCVYDDQSHPPVAKPHELVYQPLDPGESGVRRIHLELTNGSTITVDDDALTITLGGTSFELKRDGDVTLKTQGSFTLDATGDVELSAQGSLKLTAQTDLTASGLSTTVEGQAQTKLKGAQVAVAGITQFSAA
jgi:uncharacterized protein involved in type VI secretion and phage assembly